MLFGWRAILLVALLLAGTPRASGLVINFEVIPGGAPSDGLSISDQFAASDGVTFELTNGAAPVLIKTGDQTGPIGFIYQKEHLANTPAPGTDIGSYYLTDDGILGPAHGLALNFSWPMASVGGQIIDVDHSDAWAIDAFDAAGAVVDQQTITADSPGAGDGTAAPFFVTSSANNITAVTLTYTGDGTAPGFGWDNFTVVRAPVVPLPPSALTGGTMLTLLWLRSLWRRAANRR